MNAGMGIAPSTFTGAYDGDRNATRQVFPNGLTALTTLDNAGNKTRLTYSMAGWNTLVFTEAPSVNGQAIQATSPQSSQIYTYDPAGRLTQVQDADSAANTCLTRTYTFSLNSNRTQVSDYADTGNGICTTSTTPTSNKHI
jgi:YD repeat-containing protein